MISKIFSLLMAELYDKDLEQEVKLLRKLTDYKG
jgi:hypothetical protein